MWQRLKSKRVMMGLLTVVLAGFGAMQFEPLLPVVIDALCASAGGCAP
jgi:hypothetical protein